MKFSGMRGREPGGGVAAPGAGFPVDIVWAAQFDKGVIDFLSSNS